MAKKRWPAEREQDRAYKAELRARFRKAGGCAVCGTPVQRFTLCQRHRNAHAESNRAWWHKQRQGGYINVSTT